MVDHADGDLDADLEVWGATMLKDDPGTFRRAWLIRGPEGVVHFIYGDWHPNASPELRAIDTEFLIRFGRTLMPMGYDVGYHSFAPMNEPQARQGPTLERCEWLDGRACYGDGSALHAQDVFLAWLAHDYDLDWLFDYLRGYYRSVFRTDGEGPPGLGEMLLAISNLFENTDSGDDA